MQAFIDELRSSPATARILIAGTVLQIVFMLLHGINKLLLGDGLLLALDSDPNLPSWTTTALFTLAGTTSLLLGWLRRERRTALYALAAITLFVSFLQEAQLHKELEEAVPEPFSALIQAAIGVIFASVIAWAATVLPSMPRVVMLGALVAAAVSFGSSAMNRLFDLPYALLIFFQTVEEVCEMLTAIFVIAALAQPVIDTIVARVRADETPAASGG